MGIAVIVVVAMSWVSFDPFYYLDLTGNSGIKVVRSALPNTGSLHYFAKKIPIHYELSTRHGILNFKIDVRDYWPNLTLHAKKSNSDANRKILVSWRDPCGKFRDVQSNHRYIENPVKASDSISLVWGTGSGCFSMEATERRLAAKYPVEIQLFETTGEFVESLVVKITVEQNGYIDTTVVP